MPYQVTAGQQPAGRLWWPHLPEGFQPMETAVAVGWLK